MAHAPSFAQRRRAKYMSPPHSAQTKPPRAEKARTAARIAPLRASPSPWRSG